MKKTQWVFVLIVCLSFWNKADAFSATHAIQEIPSHGIVITEPGTYVFRKNITWHPDPDAVAITIQANDVTLNLDGHTLKSSSISTSSKTIGISANLSENLKILNGKIENMGLTGVQCALCANVTIRNIEVDGLSVSDVVNFVVPTGILASESFNVHVDQCTVKNINVKTASCAAIQFTLTLSSRVTGCKIKNLLNRDGACTGIGHLLCVDAQVKSSSLEKLQSKFINNLNTEGHTAIGIIPVLSLGITIKDCSISSVTGCCDDAHGVSVFLCENAIVEKCNVSNILDGAGKAKKGAKTTGIEVYANNVIVKNCSVKNIFAINPEDKQATGFSCALSNNVAFIRCRAKNVQVYDAHGNQSPVLGFGTGFGWAPDPRPSLLMPAVNVLYRECVAKDCQVGFDSWFHINSVWDQVVSVDNEIAILDQGPEAQRTLSCSPCSECGCTQIGCFPTPYVVTVNNVAANNTFTGFGEGEFIIQGD